MPGRAGPSRAQPRPAAARARSHVLPRARQRTSSRRPPPTAVTERRGPARLQRRHPPHTAWARPRTVLRPPSERTPRTGGRWAALPSLMPSPRGEARRGSPPGRAYHRGRTATAGARPHRPRRRPRRGRARGIPAGGGAGARLRSRPLAAPPLSGRSGRAGLPPPPSSGPAPGAGRAPRRPRPSGAPEGSDPFPRLGLLRPSVRLRLQRSSRIRKIWDNPIRENPDRRSACPFAERMGAI